MLKVALDLDDTIFVWRQAHEALFKCSIDTTDGDIITAQVNTLKNNGKFWSNLALLERPDFTPALYCTKRVNKKIYTMNCLRKYHLPVLPILQLYNQSDNKAEVLKGVADVLIDDSYFNVKQCLDAGFPALLITRPHNAHIKTKYRINSLTFSEIESKYNELFNK